MLLEKEVTSREFGAAFIPKCLHCGAKGPNQYAPWAGVCKACVAIYKDLGMTHPPHWLYVDLLPEDDESDDRPGDGLFPYFQPDPPSRPKKKPKSLSKPGRVKDCEAVQLDLYSSLEAA